MTSIDLSPVDLRTRAREETFDEQDIAGEALTSLALMPRETSWLYWELLFPISFYVRECAARCSWR
jgi:hypothetical protein